MSQLYRELILDHYQNPQNTGMLSPHTHEAVEENTNCGDSTSVQLNLKDGKILEVKHVTEGCAISIASSSLLSEDIKGKTTEEIEKFDEKYIIKLLGGQLTTSRMNCALLPLKAIQKALLK